MTEIRLTKSEMRDQQNRLQQLEKYLPTLQLKKAMLQLEIVSIRQEIEKLEKEQKKRRDYVEEYVSLLGKPFPIPLEEVTRVDIFDRRIENIAGVEVPYVDRIVFHPVDYALYSVPGWVDSAVLGLQELVRAEIEVGVAEKRRTALEKELRDVSIRVNLFEKRLIPRAQENIKKIRIFLGDQELAAVSRAKVAKTKIEQRKNKEGVKAHAN